MSSRLTKAALREALRDTLPEVWQSGGAGKEALREELNVDEYCHNEAYLLKDMNRLFWGRITPYDPETKTLGDQQTPDPNVYLEGLKKNKGATIPITKPTNYRYLAFYTRRMFRYPFAYFKFKLPTTPYTGTVWWGFEPEGAPSYGSSYFAYGTASGELLVYIKGKLLEITPLLPADATEKSYSYAVKLDKDSAWFYIGDSLVAVGLHNTFDFSISGPPYYLFGSSFPHVPCQSSFIELDTGGGEELSWYLEKWVVTDGDPKPPRPLDLYQSGSSTKMRGSVIDAGSLTSHPFPLLGYNNSTIHFQADQNGTLLIQVYTLGGNWRTYNTAAEEQTVTADELFSYTILGSAILGRVVFTPAAYPCTIAEAEVMLQ